MPYPEALTTSDWVDYLATLATRDDKIQALATFHRRIEFESRQRELADLAHPDDAMHVVVRAVAAQALEALRQSVVAQDYHPLGLPIGRSYA